MGKWIDIAVEIEQVGNAGSCHSNKAGCAAQYPRRRNDRNRVMQERFAREMSRQLQGDCCRYGGYHNPDSSALIDRRVRPGDDINSKSGASALRTGSGKPLNHLSVIRPPQSHIERSESLGC
jgi:hypothetical protein